MQEQSVVTIIVAVIGAVGYVTSALIMARSNANARRADKTSRRTASRPKANKSKAAPIYDGKAGPALRMIRSALIGCLYLVAIFFGIIGLNTILSGFGFPGAVLAVLISFFYAAMSAGWAYHLQTNWKP